MSMNVSFNGRGHGIRWELDRVDQQIQLVQSEIGVLKQQLRIVQSYCNGETTAATAVAAASMNQSNQLDYVPRYRIDGHMFFFWFC